jgi:hypothetical protein
MLLNYGSGASATCNIRPALFSRLLSLLIRRRVIPNRWQRENGALNGRLSLHEREPDTLLHCDLLDGRLVTHTVTVSAMTARPSITSSSVTASACHSQNGGLCKPRSCCQPRMSPPRAWTAGLVCMDIGRSDHAVRTGGNGLPNHRVHRQETPVRNPSGPDRCKEPPSIEQQRLNKGRNIWRANPGDVVIACGRTQRRISAFNERMRRGVHGHDA